MCIKLWIQGITKFLPRYLFISYSIYQCIYLSIYLSICLHFFCLFISISVAFACYLLFLFQLSLALALLEDEEPALRDKWPCHKCTFVDTRCPIIIAYISSQTLSINLSMYLYIYLPRYLFVKPSVFSCRSLHINCFRCFFCLSLSTLSRSPSHWSINISIFIYSSICISICRSISHLMWVSRCLSFCDAHGNLEILVQRVIRASRHPSSTPASWPAAAPRSSWSSARRARPSWCLWG